MGIRFDSVTVAYDGNVVLDALDLTVEPGEVSPGGLRAPPVPPYPPRLRRLRRRRGRLGRSARRRRPRGRPHPKVLVIGLDGALLSRIEDADAPNPHALMAAGLTAPSSIYADPLAPALSGPGWSTIITGVWPDKHNVVSYDGGTPVSVRTYTADVPSRTETVTLQVPAGATSARVRFRYTGGNNWFRVVDGVGFGRS